MKKTILMACFLLTSFSALARVTAKINNQTFIFAGDNVDSVKESCLERLSSQKGDEAVSTITNLTVSYGNENKIFKHSLLSRSNLSVDEVCNSVTYVALLSASRKPQINPALSGEISKNILSGEYKYVMGVRTDFSIDIFQGSSIEELFQSCLASKTMKFPRGWGYGNLNVVINSLDEKSYYNLSSSSSTEQICTDAIETAFYKFNN